MQLDTTMREAGACTLDEDGLGERLAWIRAEILPHALSREVLPDGVSWTLRDVPGLAAKLDTLVALERDCCSGLVFEHGPGASAGQRRLEVRGIDPHAAVFSALAIDESRKGTTVTRLAKAAGTGTLLGLLVCCVLPIAGAAVLGASGAAFLTSLDDPGVIGGAALVFGGATFVLQGRRRRTRTSVAASPACGPDC